jgi:hypothetical protein
MVQGVAAWRAPGCTTVNIRSPNYAIANASAACAECGAWTHVIALVVPPDHEMLVESVWERSAFGAWLFYVEDLSESVQATVREFAPWYRLAPSEARGAAYWMNHCEHCGAPQEDHDLHCEPSGAFAAAGVLVPEWSPGAAPIERLVVPRRLAATAGGYSHEPVF